MNQCNIIQLTGINPSKKNSDFLNIFRIQDQDMCMNK